MSLSWAPTTTKKKSKSPGLVKNVLAICEIIFDKHSEAASLAAVQVTPPPAKKAKQARKDRHTAPVQGGHGAAEVAAAGVDPTDTSHLSLDDLKGEEDRETVLSYIRQKYGNHAGVVIQILTAWEAYGNLFRVSGELRGMTMTAVTNTAPRGPFGWLVPHATSKPRSPLSQTISRSRGTHTC